MFHFGECLQFSIDNRPSHHQCVMVFSKGDGRKSKKKCCLNGVGSHWLSPESNILDPHLITSQKNRERKRRAVEPRKVFTSFLRPLSNLPSIFNGETYSSRTNTFPHCINPNWLGYKFPLLLSSAWHYHLPLGNHSHLCSLTLAGSFCTGEHSLPVGCMELSCKDTASDLAGELRTQTMRSCCVRV